MKSYLIGLVLIVLCFGVAAPLSGDIMDRYNDELAKRGVSVKLADVPQTKEFKKYHPWYFNKQKLD